VDLSEIRQTYETKGLDLSDLSPNPITQFQNWYEEVTQAEYFEPNAMVLSTTSPEGWPRARVVLLKAFDENGFSFFTNLKSDKATDLKTSARASLTFPWISLRRQVNIIGESKQLTAEEADIYWLTRPRGSQIGAWASHQSAVVPDREHLDEKFKFEEERWEGQTIKRPNHWGGFRIIPERFEFWQGRPNRFHDRLCYRRIENDWLIERLSP
tara:strand:+ start:135 stop:770 length:636 start_codon:yes stop_codon:yes gene_type:complete